MAVNRDNFRTCEKTAFCRRAKASKQVFRALKELREKTSTSVTLTVVNDAEESEFALKISGIANGIFRVHMTHVNGGDVFKRYEPQLGTSLTEDGIKEVPVSISANGDALMVINGDSVLEVFYDTLVINMYVSTTKVITMNANQSLRFEVGLKTINGKEVDGAGDETFKTFTDTKRHGPTGVAVGYTFPLARQFFGVPEHATSVILKPTDESGYNEPYRLYNTDVFEFEIDNPMTLYGSVPIIYSLSKHAAGVFHHNPTETFVDVVEKDVRFISESGVLDEFLLPGPTPEALVRQYLQLTGVSPMMPKYTLAYHQCRWNYMTQDECYDVIKKMDEAKVPFDVLWLDIEHTDDKKYFTWKKSSFPDPPELLNRLGQTDRHLVTIVDPHIKKTTSFYVYKEAEADGYLIKKKDGKTNYEGWCWSGNSAYIDFINPNARKWWATLFAFDKYQYSSERLMIWNDMNEPSVFNGPETTMQKDNVHTDGAETYEHRDVHNIYGLMYQMSTYNGLLERTKGRDRPFVLSRSFFAGSQKFGSVWTGDTDSTWSHLKESVAMTINLNLVGIIHSGGDVGGFFRNPDDELLVRWYQVGTFYPFFREHAHLESKHREPYLYSGDTFNEIKAAIELKYYLLEYWYREYYLAIKNKSPLLKPLFFVYYEDKEAEAADEEFLAGNDLLVVGVFEPNARTVKRYIPSGVWYDYYTNEVQKQGWDNVPVTMDSIPVYVRGGSVIPVKERHRRSSELMKRDPYTLLIYVDASGKAEGDVYIDDGLTVKSNHVLSHISVDASGIKCTVVEDVKSEELLQSKEINKIVVIGMKQPKTLTSANRLLSFDEYRTKQLSGKGFVIRKPLLQMNKQWTIDFGGHAEL